MTSNKHRHHPNKPDVQALKQSNGALADVPFVAHLAGSDTLQLFCFKNVVAKLFKYLHANQTTLNIKVTDLKTHVSLTPPTPQELDCILHAALFDGLTTSTNTAIVNNNAWYKMIDSSTLLSTDILTTPSDGVVRQCASVKLSVEHVQANNTSSNATNNNGNVLLTVKPEIVSFRHHLIAQYCTENGALDIQSMHKRAVGSIAAALPDLKLCIIEKVRLGSEEELMEVQRSWAAQGFRVLTVNTSTSVYDEDGTDGNRDGKQPTHALSSVLVDVRFDADEDAPTFTLPAIAVLSESGVQCVDDRVSSGRVLQVLARLQSRFSSGSSMGSTNFSLWPAKQFQFVSLHHRQQPSSSSLLPVGNSFGQQQQRAAPPKLMTAAALLSEQQQKKDASCCLDDMLGPKIDLASLVSTTATKVMKKSTNDDGANVAGVNVEGADAFEWNYANDTALNQGDNNNNNVDGIKRCRKPHAKPGPQLSKLFEEMELEETAAKRQVAEAKAAAVKAVQQQNKPGTVANGLSKLSLLKKMPAAGATAKGATNKAAAAGGGVKRKAAVAKTPAASKKTAAAAAAGNLAKDSPAAAIDTPDQQGQGKPGTATLPNTVAATTAVVARTKAPKAPRAPKPPAAEIDIAALDVPSKAQAGTLGSLTIPQMKAYLKSVKLAVGGKKGELEERIKKHLGLVVVAVERW